MEIPIPIPDFLIPPYGPKLKFLAKVVLCVALGYAFSKIYFIMAASITAATHV